MSADQLATITRDIERAHTAAAGAMRDAVSHAVRAGELLAQAKASLAHGDFGAFCAALPFAATTARGYMRLAALRPAERQRIADLPLRTALLQIAKLRAASISSPEVPLGSFGVSIWREPCGTIRWFEAHPTLLPDGETIGMHYALATVPESGAVTCDVSRRAVQMTVDQLAEAFEAPVRSMSVFAGRPVLWAAEVAV